uniref:Small ribosomal subunit protein bS20c n=1 Tax=Nicotiana tabacum TaxID=4097 RepID=A0A1S4BVE0_TOBAC|nr:PREDICTED: 30S ribosomal protein S20, chloroplastic-like [Nicotiana tabacum]
MGYQNSPASAEVREKKSRERAMAGACLSSSSCCWNLASKFNTLSLNGPHPNAAALKPLSFSANTSLNLFSKGSVSLTSVQMPFRRSIVCEAAPTKKADSAAKRARQAEKRRLYNKAKKSEVKTRMKTVLEALDTLKKKTDAQSEEVLSVEKLIAEAYSAIDKAVKAGTLHRNTGARRKSRLARRKKAVAIHHGWYVPAPVAEPDLVATA